MCLEQGGVELGAGRHLAAYSSWYGFKVVATLFPTTPQSRLNVSVYGWMVYEGVVKGSLEPHRVQGWEAWCEGWARGLSHQKFSPYRSSQLDSAELGYPKVSTRVEVARIKSTELQNRWAQRLKACDVTR